MSDNTNLHNDEKTNDINDENMLSLTDAPISTFKEILNNTSITMRLTLVASNSCL